MMNTVIQKISARQVLDCKARPMLEVDVFTQDGSMGRGAAPTGTSVGAHEAFVLRDYDVNEFNGLSVHKAVNTVETVIAPALLGMDAADQRAIDQRMLELDGTENKGDWAATPFTASPLPACALRLLPTRCRCTAIFGAEC